MLTNKLHLDSMIKRRKANLVTRFN